MPNKYTPRSPKEVDRKPDKNGMINITVTLRLSEPVYNFLMAHATAERRSISTMAAMQLEKYKENYERLMK